MKKISNIPSVSSKNVKFSRLGIGMEKLDRNVFDPTYVYDKVADIGAKWIRIQSGWVRTEKVKGQYDFVWLDEIVDNLLERGLIPWMCLCYGNALYDDTADQASGAIGRPPIHTEEARRAWARYVKAVAEHFKGRVSLYEVWNEPDGVWGWKHGVNATEYGAFAAETARSIKEMDPNAKVAGGSFCWGNIVWLSHALAAVMAETIDYITYHSYFRDVETNTEEIYRAVRATLDAYGCKAEIIQGETGCPSRTDGKGAIGYLNWSEEKQAKFLLRLLVTNLKSDMYFATWFSAVDMYENLGSALLEFKPENFGFFGLLKDNFDKTGEEKYTPKPSYKAMQNLCSVFQGDVKKTELPIMFAPDVHTGRMPVSPAVSYAVKHASFILDDGRKAFAYWKPTDIDTMSVEDRVELHIAGMKQAPKFYDLLTGDIYELDKEYQEDTKIWDGSVLGEVNPDVSKALGVWNLRLPLRDYPLLLMFE